mgnify:CR=1 FL=1
MAEDIAEIRRTNLRRIADEIGGRAALARRTGKTLSHICGMLNGDKSLGPTVARDIETKLNMPPMSLDQPDSDFVAEPTKVPEPTGYVRITALEVRKEYNLMRIQELSKIRLMECKEDWLYEQSLSTSQPKALKLLTAPSDNMEPEILQGGSVVVDISQNTFTANGIYAMTYQGSAFIYRIQMNPDGTVYFLSDNPKYEKMVVKDTSNIVIVGRCVGCCNTHSL